MPTQSFTTSDTWQAPTNVTTVTVTARGGGAAGSPNGTVAARPGGGGGGGAYAKGTIDVTPGNFYTITVGAVSSGDGNPSQVVGDTLTVTANGGTSTTTRSGGAGGAASSGGNIIASFAGGDGGTATNTNNHGGGGGGEGAGSTATGGAGQANSTSTGGAGGAGTDGGDGGAGGDNNAAGVGGTAPGGGGGGAGGNNDTFGNGARGEVVLEWEESTETPIEQPASDDMNLLSDGSAFVEVEYKIPIATEDLNNWADTVAQDLQVAGGGELTLSLSDNLSAWDDMLGTGYGLALSDEIGTLSDGSADVEFLYELELVDEIGTLADEVALTLTAAGLSLTLSDDLNSWGDAANVQRNDEGPVPLAQAVSDDLNAWNDAVRKHLGPSVVIYTANLQSGKGTDNNTDYARQLAELTKVADLICVQERNDGTSPYTSGLTAAGYTEAVYRKNGTGQPDGSAIWYRNATVNVLNTYQIDLSEGAIGWDGSTNVDKAAVAAKVRVNNIASFYIISTHLAWSAGADSEGSHYSAIRVAQIQTLLNWVNTTFNDGLDVVIAGDMNFGPNYPKNPSGLQIDLFTEDGYEDLWQVGIAEDKATADWGDRNEDSTPDMPISSLGTRTHDTRRIDYAFLRTSAGNLSLQVIGVPDLRAQCPHDLVPGGTYPSCSPEVVQQWDTPDDFGVRPSDHNWVQATLTISGENLAIVASDSLNAWQDAHAQDLSDDLAFPVPGVLDNFNRADSGTLGTNWSGPIQPTAVRNSIVSNQAAADSGGSSSEDYYNVSTFGPDVDVYLTLSTFSTTGDEARLFARLTSPNTTSVSGYAIEAEIASPSFIRILKLTNNSYTALTSQVEQSLTSGDSIGFRVRGTTLTAYHKTAAGAWTSVVQVSDSTYSTAGNVGFSLTGSSIRSDDFGAGTLAESGTLTLSVSDSLNNWADEISGDNQNRWQDSTGTFLSGDSILTLNLSDTLDSWLDEISGDNRNRWQDEASIQRNDEGTNQVNLTASDNMGTLTDGTATLGLDYDITVEGESFTLTDAFAHSLSGPADLSVTVSDNLNNWTDDVSGDNRNRWQDASETFLFGDSNLTLNLSDTLNNWLDAAQLASAGFLVLTDDANNLSDSFAIDLGTPDLVLNLSDTFTLTDDVALSLTTNVLELSLSDNLDTWADSVSLFMTHALAVSDSFSLTDAVAVNLGAGPALSIALADSLNNWADSAAVSTVGVSAERALWVDLKEVSLKAVDLSSVSILTENANSVSMITADLKSVSLITEHESSVSLKLNDEKEVSIKSEDSKTV